MHAIADWKAGARPLRKLLRADKVAFLDAAAREAQQQQGDGASAALQRALGWFRAKVRKRGQFSALRPLRPCAEPPSG